MTTTLRVTEAREVLSYVPFHLGFRPRDSVVLLGVHGERSRLGVGARVDIPVVADPRSGTRAARVLVEHLERDGSHSAFVVLYVDGDLRDRPDLTVHRLRTHLARAAAGRLHLRETWCVTPDGYYELDCVDPACCPPGGRPLTDLESTAVSAQMVLAGARVAGSREELVVLPTSTTDGRRAARKAAERWAARAQRARTDAEMLAWRAEGLRLWRTEHARAQVAARAAGLGDDHGVVDGRTLLDDRPTCDDDALRSADVRAARDALRPDRTLTPNDVLSGAPAGYEPAAVDLGRLRAALDDVLVRDAALLEFLPGAGAIADRVVAGDGGAEVGSWLGRIVDPHSGDRPDPVRTAGARTVLEHVAGHVRGGGHAPALTLLAILAWWDGDGARASVLVDRALGVDPVYRLAVLVADALDHGMPPGWARRRV